MDKTFIVMQLGEPIYDRTGWCLAEPREPFTVDGRPLVIRASSLGQARQWLIENHGENAGMVIEAKISAAQ